MLAGCAIPDPAKRGASFEGARTFARGEYDERAVGEYMEYFNDGYKAQLRGGRNSWSVLMFEGGENQWLERAHRSGQNAARHDMGWDRLFGGVAELP